MEISKKIKFGGDAVRVSLVTMAGNIILSFLKVGVGVVGHSNALVSDGIHSMSDVLSTFVVLIGIRVSGRVADEKHPYGHERLECIASMVLSVFLAVTGIGIGYTALAEILHPTLGPKMPPSSLTLWVAGISILAKELMYHYTKAAGKKLNLSSLMADAWHHRSDALSSIGSLIGIWGARAGCPVLDPLAGLIICLFILWVSIKIVIDAVNKLVDHSCDRKTVDQIAEIVLSVSGVKNIDDIKTRLFGNRIYVDIEIAADGKLTLNEAHEIARQVHDKVEREVVMVKHCMVHVNPFNEI